jgi:hypothetical protein
MALSGIQVRQLRAKLDARHIRTRKANGTNLHYVEGWHVISEANRIFGYDAWDRRTVATKCISASGNGERHFAAYTAKVRITVRAGDIIIVREGSGTGEGSGLTPGQAHEIALKSAETDATKRALATFGNPFGLALYDREQNHIRKARAPFLAGPWLLRSATGSVLSSHDAPNLLIAALRRAMSEAKDIELLYDLWEQNIDTLRALQRNSKERPGIVPNLVAYLRSCAVALVKRANTPPPQSVRSAGNRQDSAAQKIDKSALAIAEPRRVRSKEHLRYVASQPCAICGRSPSHPHHVRYAQTRGLRLKVSDEFVVPLCAIHHRQLHQTTKERAWWLERKIDPLIIAAALWRESQRRSPDSMSSSEQKLVQSPTAVAQEPPKSSERSAGGNSS